MSNSTGQRKNSFSTGWQCPSNIALVKYWGKHGNQLPNNPSVSFTLSEAATRTFVTWEEDLNTDSPGLSFLFDGKENRAFESRIRKFLDAMSVEHFPFLKFGHLSIETSNSFPHSSGIASSASAMSALSMALCDLEQMISGKSVSDVLFHRKASVISRLGSGSACRSVYPVAAIWGQFAEVPGSSDEWATGLESGVHKVFHTFHDDILIISPEEKSVSSSAGHGLMENNPYAPARYVQARAHTGKLLTALREGDLKAFGKITEDEALTLHALMMCSDPSYILMKEGSLSVINLVRRFRSDTDIPLYFTLDAGPNVHLLYPEEFEEPVGQFISSELRPLCHEGRIIRDRVGPGPQKIA